MSNTLLKKNAIRNNAPDFGTIKSEDMKEAFEVRMQEAKDKIEAIASQNEPPTFENTIIALEEATEDLEDVSSVFFNQATVNTDDVIEGSEAELGAKYSAFNSEISFNQALFQRIKTLHNKKGTLGLSEEQMTLLENTYKSFIRSGADLNATQQARLKEIGERMAALSADFKKNVRRYNEDYKLWIEDEADLAGLPDWYKEAAAAAAKEEGQEGKWLVTLDFPSYLPFMTFAQNRNLRRELWFAAAKTANEPPYDNKPIVLEMVKLRDEMAKMLGYKTYADYVLDERMAKTPERVFDFLTELRDAVYEPAKKELQEVKDLANSEDQVTDFEPWDMAFYSERLKQTKLGFSDEDLRPYYQLDKVLDGCFEHASRLFGIEFRENKDYPTYHDDVKAFDVLDKKTGAFVGTLYADFFPRKNKKEGAWETSYRKQGLYKGDVARPVVAIACNFTKPGKDRPALITHNEVETLFHEMGHALHDLLSQCEYRSTSGTSVKWDFVELPSQVMENWTFERETLDRMAEHFETGEKMPNDLYEKLRKSGKFQKALWRMRQLQFALLDMRIHTADPATITDLLDFEKQATADTVLLPGHGTCKSASFGHLFGGGYAAGYYSYQWAELLDADAFEKFKESDLYDADAAEALRKLFSQGGSRDPNVIYREFRGRDADPEAILRRDGLLPEKKSRLESNTVNQTDPVNDNRKEKKARSRPPLRHTPR